MARSRTMYAITGVHGLYLYQITETRYGQFEPDNHGGAKVRRKPGRGNDITAEYGPDLTRAKMFSDKKTASEFLGKYSVLRFCSVITLSAAQMREIRQMSE